MNNIAGMNDETLTQRLLALLTEVAPDVEAATVRLDRDFRDQFDFDSMDLFNFATAIVQTFGVDIPERDYRRLLSIEKAAEYLRNSPAGR